MIDLLKPMAETAMRHGATVLAALIAAAIFGNPIGATIAGGAGLTSATVTSVIVGGAMAVFGLGWSYIKNVKFAAK